MIMDEQTARAVERSKRISIALAWLIIAVDFAMAMLVGLPQIVVMLLFFGSFLPYLIHLQYVRPRLEERGKQRLGGGGNDRIKTGE